MNVLAIYHRSLFEVLDLRDHPNIGCKTCFYIGKAQIKEDFHGLPYDPDTRAQSAFRQVDRV